MKSVHSFSIFTATALLVACSASPENPSGEDGTSHAPEASSSATTIYGRELSYEPCSPDDAPRNAVCYFNGPSGQERCAPGNGQPLPPFYWYKPICDETKFSLHEDGEIIGTPIPAGAPKVVCGHGLDSVTLHYIQPGQVLMHLPASYDNIAAGVVRANAEYSIAGGPSGSELVVALQKYESGAWSDVKAKASMSRIGIVEARGIVEPNTLVRLELRAGPGNYRDLTVVLKRAQLFGPVCVPDMDRPGECL